MSRHALWSFALLLACAPSAGDPTGDEQGELGESGEDSGSSSGERISSIAAGW